MAGTDICTFDFNKDGSTLSWTAFKTPKKVGVKAKFSEFTVKSKKSASIDDLLASATIEVNSQSVDSGDKGRDVKIMSFFFKKMLKGTKILGKVLKSSENKALVEFTMNGITKNIEMITKFDDAAATLTLSGKMDVLEFGMKDNLAAITKACYEKHEGVTWPDVELEFVTKLIKSCK
jgi:polyisoprenoid-binding protein YceI